jgi:hypothetical protein
VADIVHIGLKITAQGADQIKKIRTGLDDIDKKAAKVGLSMRNLKRALLAVGAASAALALVSKKLLILGSDALETRNKFTETFGAATSSVDAFLDEFNKISGLSKATSENLVADMGHIAQGFGFAQQASADFAIEITKLAGDLASFKNVGADRAAMAIMSAMTGEREQLKQLGIILRQLDVDQLALEKSGKQLTSQLNDMDRAYASLALITERAGIAIGDLARTSDSTANALKQMGGAWLTLKEKMGEFLATSDLVNKFVIAIRDFFNNLSTILEGQKEDIRNMFDALGDIAGNAFLGGIAKAFEKLAGLGIPIISDIFSEAQFKALGEQSLEGFLAGIERVGHIARGVVADIELATIRAQQAALASGLPMAPGGKPFQMQGITVTAPRPTPGPARRPLGFGQITTLSDALAKPIHSFETMLQRLQPSMMTFESSADNAANKLQGVAIASMHAAANLGLLIKRGGGFGSILSGIIGTAGGIASAIPGGQVIGAGMLAGGSLLGGLTAPSNKPVPVEVSRYGANALNQRRDNEDPMNMTIIYETGGKEIERIQRVLRRAQLRDGVIRLAA